MEPASAAMAAEVTSLRSSPPVDSAAPYEPESIVVFHPCKHETMKKIAMCIFGEKGVTSASSALCPVCHNPVTAYGPDITKPLSKRTFNSKNASYALEQFGICFAMVQGRNLTGALKIANKIRHQGNGSLALSYVSEGMAKAGRTKDAVEIANRIPSSLFRAQALQAASVAISKGGDIKEGLLVANTIFDEYHQANALREISAVMVKAEDNKGALDVAKGAADLAHRISTDAFRGATLQEISVVIAEAGDVKEAVDTANSILHAHYQEDNKGLQFLEEHYKEVALHKISLVIAKAGDSKGALDVANSIPNYSFRIFALNEIAVALAKTGKMEEACKVVNTIPDDDYQARVIHEIAVAIAKPGKIEEAREVANRIPNTEYRASVLQDISTAITHPRESKEAINPANIQENLFWRDISEQEIALTQAKAGKFTKARDVAHWISNEEYRARALKKIMDIEMSLPSYSSNKEAPEEMDTTSLVAEASAQTEEQVEKSLAHKETTAPYNLRPRRVISYAGNDYGQKRHSRIYTS